MHCSLVCVVPLKLLISLHGFLTALQISFWLSLPLRVTYRSHKSFPFYPLLPDRAVVWCCWPLLVTDWCSLHISASLGSCLQPTCFRSSFKNIVLVRILNLLSSSDRRKFPSTLRFSALHTGHSWIRSEFMVSKLSENTPIATRSTTISSFEGKKLTPQESCMWEIICTLIASFAFLCVPHVVKQCSATEPSGCTGMWTPDMQIHFLKDISG